jgi:hypothetical protein
MNRAATEFRRNCKQLVQHVVSAINDRLEQMDEVPDELLQDAKQDNLKGYWWGIVEQASHTLWFGGIVTSPAECNAVLERIVCRCLVHIADDKQGYAFDEIGVGDILLNGKLAYFMDNDTHDAPYFD